MQVESEQGVRIADDGIYLTEDRYEKPKEMFKFIHSLLPSDRLGRGIDWLDVGCATGEFLYYVRNQYSSDRFTGIDISPDMIKKAQAKMPLDTFVCQNILSERPVETSQYDIVTCTGVLQIFDDLEMPIERLLTYVKSGGLLVITGSVSSHDIDVLMKYRRVGKSATWETGWNLFSTNTYEKFIKNHRRPVSIHWHDFEMPYEIRETRDPMRTWTIKTEANEHQLINGAGQLLYVKACLVKV